MSYVSLHNHTSSSNERLIDSINKPELLIQHAFDIGLKGIAITDHETLNSHVKCLNYLNKMREKDEAWKNFKVILGNEIYLCRNGLSNDNFESGKDNFYHFILLAKDEEGHHQLRKLSTRAYEHSWMRNKMRRVPTYYSDIEEIIGENPGHIVASTACIGGYLGKKLLKFSTYENNQEYFNAQIETLKDWIRYIQSIFGKENFYLELQPSYNDEQIYVNKWLINFSKELNVPAIITTDSHYYSKNDRAIHKAFLNSKEGDREVDEFYASAYMMTAEEIHEYLDETLGEEQVKTCLNQTIAIASTIKEYQLKRAFKLPYLPSQEDIELSKNINFNFPRGMKIDEPWTYFMNSPEPSDRVFIHRIINKCNSDKERFWSKQSLDEIEIELKTVKDASIKQNMVWSRYFLQVADYVNIMWTDGDSIVGPGRGSGVGFYLNYLLDITQIDPLREKVPLKYWRFLNPERASILDIDSDCQTNRRNKIIEALQKRYGEKRVVRVLTKKTEASKSAILTAARGLGIDVDIAQFIASMIESDRGAQRSLHDTYYGNVDKDFPANKTFREEMDKYPELWKVAQSIEGIETSCSSHAGGVIIVDEDFTNTSSMMKLNSGEWVSCWDLHESEDSAGQVKIDLLSTEALTYIRTCLNLLVEEGLTPKMPTLRETYEKCIGVYALDRADEEMWKRLGEGELLNIFQMDTPQGKQGLNLVRPTNVEELTAINSVMRLMSEEKGAEQPLAKYTRFKNNENDWDNEMIAAGLTLDERKLLHSYLDIEHGLAVSQEEMMMLLLEPKIAGWPLGQVDKCRKSIAKKNLKLYEELSKEFFENAKDKELSTNLVNYVWNILIAPQRSYSFCSAHGLAYSIVGLQEMNLACKYPTIFWNTANLIVDSAGADFTDENNEEDEDEEDDEAEIETKEEVKRVKKTMDYGRTAAAIGKFQNLGITVLPPDINNSSFTFTPNAKNNTITYGLRGITRVSIDLVKEIIKNRPYSSLNDFLQKVKTNKLQTVNLIKSGAFDAVEAKKREEILYNYIASTCDTKKRVTMQNMAALINYDLIPANMIVYKKLFLFNKYLKTCKKGIYYMIGEEALDFISEYSDVDLIIDGEKILQSAWEKEYKNKIKPMQEYIKSNAAELLKKLNESIINEEMEKYGQGNVSHWEMESVSFYNHPHELSYANTPFDSFFSLSPEPIVTSCGMYKGKEYRNYEIFQIAGTVIDKDKNHDIVTLLTMDGVVPVKIYKNQFADFDKQISRKNADGKKTIVEKSWFSRGTLLIVQGYRRDNNFILKKSKTSPLPVIRRIDKIEENGYIVVTDKRADSE